VGRRGGARPPRARGVGPGCGPIVCLPLLLRVSPALEVSCFACQPLLLSLFRQLLLFSVSLTTRLPPSRFSLPLSRSRGRTCACRIAVFDPRPPPCSAFRRCAGEHSCHAQRQRPQRKWWWWWRRWRRSAADANASREQRGGNGRLRAAAAGRGRAPLPMADVFGPEPAGGGVCGADSSAEPLPVDPGSRGSGREGGEGSPAECARSTLPGHVAGPLFAAAAWPAAAAGGRACWADAGS
jgi:hypothetical protein